MDNGPVRHASAAGCGRDRNARRGTGGDRDAHGGFGVTGGHIDAAEVARFAALAAEWWDPAGPFAPLHKLNPLRLGWIKEQAAARFGRDYRDPKALAGLTALDIGCGGGLVAEPLARMGATVTGIDPGVETIAAARSHAEAAGLAIDYRAASV